MRKSKYIEYLEKDIIDYRILCDDWSITYNKLLDKLLKEQSNRNKDLLEQAYQEDKYKELLIRYNKLKEKHIKTLEEIDKDDLRR